MCDCISKFDEHLKGHNTRIARGFALGPGTLDILPPFVRTEKLNSSARGKPISVLASYCPFCGEKYQTVRTGNQNRCGSNCFSFGASAFGWDDAKTDVTRGICRGGRWTADIARVRRSRRSAVNAPLRQPMSSLRNTA